MSVLATSHKILAAKCLVFYFIYRLKSNVIDGKDKK